MTPEKIYNMLVYIATWNHEDGEKLRHRANILAVKNTWKIYNQPRLLLDTINMYRLLKG